MPDEPDYYEILGVRPEATLAEIKRAHRELAKKYHPDACRTSRAVARFGEIQEAYEVLRDPISRRAYDRRRALAAEPLPPKPAPAPAAPARPAASPAANSRGRHFVQSNRRHAGTGIEWETWIRHVVLALIFLIVAVFVLVPYAKESKNLPTEPRQAHSATTTSMPSGRQRAKELQWEAQLAWIRLQETPGAKPTDKQAERVQIHFALGAKAVGRGEYARAIEQYQTIVALCADWADPTTRPKAVGETPSRGPAHEAWAGLHGVDRAHGIGAKLDEARAGLDLADWSRQQGHLKDAEANYATVLDKCRRIRLLDAARNQAWRARSAWRKVGAECGLPPARPGPASPWTAVWRIQQQAEYAWRHRDFEQARAQWTRAADMLPEAAWSARVADAAGRTRALLARRCPRQAERHIASALALRPWDLQALLLREDVRTRLMRTLDLGGGAALRVRWIPPGAFVMGSGGQWGRQSERPTHRVRISRGFYLGQTEVTQEQYQAVMGGAAGQGRSPRRPVTGVSWLDANAFCHALSKRVGATVRLPTEAEWEYACRAGSVGIYCFGYGPADLRRYGNAMDWGSATAAVRGNDGYRGVAPVASFLPNAWGLYDMHGNVWEWCQDRFSETYYTAAEVTDPTGPKAGDDHVLRGGSWGVDAIRCTSAHRNQADDNHRDRFTGFRIVLEAPAPTP